jgi:probable RNA-binding protein EIF1AD
VIVECGDEEETTADNNDQDAKKEGTTGFRYVISHILYKDQVKHIKSKGLWPADSFFEDDLVERGQKTKKPQDENDQQQDDDEEASDDEYEYANNNGGIVFDDPLSDELMVNTNRIAAMRVEDSSSDESDD